MSDPFANGFGGKRIWHGALLIYFGNVNAAIAMVATFFINLICGHSFQAETPKNTTRPMSENSALYLEMRSFMGVISSVLFGRSEAGLTALSAISVKLADVAQLAILLQLKGLLRLGFAKP